MPQLPGFVTTGINLTAGMAGSPVKGSQAKLDLRCFTRCHTLQHRPSDVASTDKTLLSRKRTIVRKYTIEPLMYNVKARVI